MASSAAFLALVMFLKIIHNENMNKMTFMAEEYAESNETMSENDVECVSDAYPPPQSSFVPKYVINLDLPPEERWKELGKTYSSNLKELLSAVRNVTHPLFRGLLFKLVDKFAPKLLETFPNPFRDEIKGMANASGIPLGEMTLFNVFYEIFTVCTSIVGQSSSGNLYHGRNLDFGIFLGWDKNNGTWLTTEILRTMTVDLDFQRNGTTVFRATNFVGYVGIVTGMRPYGFSLTVDERFKFVGGYIGVAEWLLGKRSGHWMSFLTRQVLENATSYAEAQKILAKSELLAPVYFILGGNKTGQASVITRGLKFVDIWDLGAEIQNGSWYLVETNYDHWKRPPFYDNRRAPAKQCLDEYGSNNFTLGNLFNVLSTKPVKNKLTAYTTLMQVANGTTESYLQHCPDPCPEF